MQITPALSPTRTPQHLQTVAAAIEALNTDIDSLIDESLKEVLATILAYHVTLEYYPNIVRLFAWVWCGFFSVFLSLTHTHTIAQAATATSVLPISTTLGEQAALALYPRKDGDSAAFTLQAENILASPLLDGPVYADDSCGVAVYLIDSVLLPKIVYPALGLTGDDTEEEASPPAASISG